MVIVERDYKDMNSNWSYKLALELLFKSMPETDRKNVWSDGEFYFIDGKYYLVYNSVDGSPIMTPIACLVSTKSVINPKNKSKSSADVDCLTLFVNPKNRKRNVATWLVERAMRKSKAAYLMAKVKRDNRASLLLFKNLGFWEMDGKNWEWLGSPEHQILLAER